MSVFGGLDGIVKAKIELEVLKRKVVSSPTVYHKLHQHACLYLSEFRDRDDDKKLEKLGAYFDKARQEIKKLKKVKRYSDFAVDA